MNNRQLLSENSIVHLTVDGTNYTHTLDDETANSSVVAFDGCEELTFLMIFGAMDAGDVVITAQDSLLSGSGFADIAGTEVTVNNVDDKMVAISIKNTGKTYARLETVVPNLATGVVVASLIAIRSYNKQEPVSQLETAGQFAERVALYS